MSKNFYNYFKYEFKKVYILSDEKALEANEIRKMTANKLYYVGKEVI